VDIGDYYVIAANGQFVLYSVVGFLVLSLLLLFVISMVRLGFTASWFLLGFLFCCSSNDILPDCVVESDVTGFLRGTK
jgi:hypothetical protein